MSPSINKHPDVTIVSKWKPRPPLASATARHDYHAGYSDGFYGYHFGAGHAEAANSDAYRLGFTHGRVIY